MQVLRSWTTGLKLCLPPKLTYKKEKGSFDLIYDLVFMGALEKLAELPEENTFYELRDFTAIYFPLIWLWYHTSMYLSLYSTPDFIHHVLFYFQLVGIVLFSGIIHFC
jgi:low temperature requirement protein LtrA